jgi:hypothetical protein
LRGFRIRQDRPRALINEVAIVIPDDDFLLRQSFALDRWSKMILEEITLFLG